MRRRYCVDATVIGRWLFSDSVEAAKVDALLLAFQAGEIDLCAPDLIVGDFGGLLLTSQKSGLVQTDHALSALEAVAAAGIQLVPAHTYAPAALATAAMLGITFYDASYIAVAEAAGCPLLTADRRLAELVADARPFVTTLTEFSSLGPD